MYQITKRYTKILIALWSFFNFLTFCKECIICMLAVNIAYFVCKCRHLNNCLIWLAMRNNYSIIIIIHWNTWSRRMFDTRHMRLYNLLHVELRSYSTFQDLFLFYFFYCFGFLFFFTPCIYHYIQKCINQGYVQIVIQPCVLLLSHYMLETWALKSECNNSCKNYI